MSDQILSVDSADIGFNDAEPLIEGVELTLGEGEILGLTGRSGIGKTTLIRTCAGLIPTLSGTITFAGVPLASKARGDVGLIPQRLGLIQHQTVGYNVLMGALPRANWYQSLFSLPSTEMREATRKAVEAVGLQEKILTSVNSLSGGQQRRVAIARAMVQNPKLILADECLGELDAETAKDIIDLLRNLADSGTSILIVDHNPVRARTFCDRVLQLRGKILLELGDDEQDSVPALPVLRRPEQ
ncbi:MAG: ATP-binding cassette domain-containing protein [Candidatus Thalassarchaeum sp.]